MLGRLVAVALAFSSVVAEPLLSRSVVHERRNALPPGWSTAGAAPADATMRLRLGLAQRNMHKLDEYLLDVSHPESPNYGKHWTTAQVADTFAPAPESIDTVRTWLASVGVAPQRVRLAPGKVWLELNATVAEAEKLLATDYKVYAHESGAHKLGESCSLMSTWALTKRPFEVAMSTISRNTSQSTSRSSLPQSTLI